VVIKRGDGGYKWRTSVRSVEEWNVYWSAISWESVRMSLRWFEHWTEFWRGWREDRKRNVEMRKRMFKVELLERRERMMSKFGIL
jgi:hypothetical protein